MKQRTNKRGEHGLPLVQQHDSSQPRLARRRRRKQPGSVVVHACSRILLPFGAAFAISAAVGTLFFKTPRERPLEFNPLIRPYMDLYRQVYALARQKRHLPVQKMTTRSPLSDRYGSQVTKCELTIVFMDPRLGNPDYPHGQAAWFALESIGAFAPPQACVVLQAAKCVVQQHIEPPMDDLEAAVADNIYDKSLPLFRERIEQERVRVSFLDHEKYQLKSCSDFSNPSAAWMNIKYWKDEFVDGVDSDLLLMMQDDTVLCYPLQLRSEWLTASFLGALWPKTSNPLSPDPMEGMCLGMRNRWKTWLLSQRQWEREQQQLQERDQRNNKHRRPKELLNPTFPSVCDHGEAPMGNGGFSLRSRKWMVRAIETCPHIKFSGLALDDDNQPPPACKVLDETYEDFYFGTVLRGIGAPFPSVTSACLFATEMLWPEDAMDLYGADGNNKDAAALVNDNIPSPPRIRYLDRTITVPAGLHKPWWYHSNDILLSPEMSLACPYLPFVFEPDMSRYKDLQYKAPAGAIGH